MFIDTHAHYDDKAFDEDRDALLQSLFSSGIEHIINPGCDIRSTLAAQELAHRFNFVSYAAGIHPEELKDLPADPVAQIRQLASDAKCVAIGEIGLDYYWDVSQKDLQKQLFRAQLELAIELDKPAIIHDREAHGDSLEIIREYPSASGVFHCFSGSREMAAELLSRGWYLGFDGPITYKNARKALEVLEETPLDRILLETDSPYLSPVPNRGKRNCSSNLCYVASKIAEIKQLELEKVARITSENARRLFRIA